MNIKLFGAGGVGSIIGLAAKEQGATVEFVDSRLASSNSEIERTFSRFGKEFHRDAYPIVNSLHSPGLVVISTKVSEHFWYCVEEVQRISTGAEILLIQNGLAFLLQSSDGLDLGKVRLGVVTKYQGTLYGSNVELGDSSFHLRTNLEELGFGRMQKGGFHFEFQYSKDMLNHLWEKFVRWAPLSLMGGLSNQTVEKLMLSPTHRKELQKLVSECESLAESFGYKFAKDPMTEIERLPPNTMTSSARSIAMNKKSELEQIYEFAPNIFPGDETMKVLNLIKSRRRS